MTFAMILRYHIFFSYSETFKAPVTTEKMAELQSLPSGTRGLSKFVRFDIS